VIDDVRWNNPSEHDIGPIFKEKATRCMTIEDYWWRSGERLKTLRPLGGKHENNGTTMTRGGVRCCDFDEASTLRWTVDEGGDNAA
jgi:hypothetical protein